MIGLVTPPGFVVVFLSLEGWYIPDRICETLEEARARASEIVEDGAGCCVRIVQLGTLKLTTEGSEA